MQNDPLGQFETWALQIPPERLGRMMKEYIAESNHGGWDGFTRADLTGIRRFLTDLRIAYEAADERTFTELSSVNPI